MSVVWRSVVRDQSSCWEISCRGSVVQGSVVGQPSKYLFKKFYGYLATLLFSATSLNLAPFLTRQGLKIQIFCILAPYAMLLADFFKTFQALFKIFS